MEKRLIDANTLMQEIATECTMYDGAPLKQGVCILLDKWEVLDRIYAAPPVDAEPVRHGRWIFDNGVDHCCKCSECKGAKPPHYIADNYCPNCGAKMRGDKDATE